MVSYFTSGFWTLAKYFKHFFNIFYVLKCSTVIAWLYDNSKNIPKGACVDNVLAMADACK